LTTHRATAVGVRFIATASGREPVSDWLRALDRETRRVVGVELRTLQLGWPLGMPLVRKLEPGLWESRTRVGPAAIRIFFTLFDGDLVLLHALFKKSQALPLADLELARTRMKELTHDP
jgi:phage-related protein